MNSRLVLAGDIGGTNARFALATSRFAAGDPQVGADHAATDQVSASLVAANHSAANHSAAYHVADFAGPGEAIARFLADGGRTGARIGAACFAVAGPIVGRSAQLTNAPWLVDAVAIAERFGIGEVRLVNDFAAAAAGIETLAPAQLAVLQTGESVPDAPRLVIGAGTGLGVAFLVHDGNRYRIVAGEGGHVGFAPADAEQAALWAALHDRLGRVQAEDVVSGTGLVNIYAFVIARHGVTTLPTDVQREGAAAVSRRGLDAGEPDALHAIDLFIRCFGAIAGDHALSILARGGVYVAGGIAPKLVDRLRSGSFIDAFNAKGSHAVIARRLPVAVVLEERLGLLGAMRLAEQALEGTGRDAGR